MTFTGFEGPAGTGKTHELIECVRRLVARLKPHQRVLALTFMHGSRQRLEERLNSFPETRGRSVCMTIDAFAANLVRRWQCLLPSLPHMKEFDAVCDSCGTILERPEVGKWIAATFPIVAIDEAQELKPCRLRIAKALTFHTNLYVAADEFQCLDDEVDTGPFLQWFGTGKLIRLSKVLRTGKQGLLAAGLALRQSGVPKSGSGLKIRYEFPNQMRFAIGHALNSARGTTLRDKINSPLSR